MRGICLIALLGCIGCGKPPAPVVESPVVAEDQLAPPENRTAFLKDRPLGSKIRFNAIHYAEGKDHPREFDIRGTLNGPGSLELNPNHLTLNAAGRITGSTLMDAPPIAVRIEAVDRPDPEGRGRKVFDIVPETGERARRYSLILAPNEAGMHQLLIREGERVVGTYPMVDPDRQEHEDLGPKLASATPQEQISIAELRKAIGYSFRFRLELKNAVTFLYFPEAEDIVELDLPLQGFEHLLSLYFRGGRLRPEGLKCLRRMPSLKSLSFNDCEIDDEGLACVKDSAQMALMSFFGCRGISDKGLSHFQGLTNLKNLDLRNEKFTATEPKAPRITDAGLKHLAGLKKLEYLNLQGQHITDDGLKHLSEMSNLQTLSLSFSGITDEGLKHLEGLKELRKLHLYGNRCTPEGLAALKAQLPLLDR